MTDLDVSRWQLFLKDLGIEAGLTPRHIEVLIYQFDPQREHWSVEGIKRSIKKALYIEPDNYKRIAEDNIYPKFQKNFKNLEADYQKDREEKVKDKKLAEEERAKKNNAKSEAPNGNVTKDKDTTKNGNSTKGEDTIRDENKKLMWQWLKREYPQWEEKFLGRSQLGIDALWSRLKDLGKYAPDRLGMYVAENDIEKASALPKGYQPKPFLDEVTQGTQGLKFKIVSENMGQVLLLNCGEANVVYCLCPSEFSPSINLHRGEKIVPQTESTYAYLGAEMRGKEEWWGWIVSEMPPLSWLGAARDTALQLNAVQLAELLSQVELQRGEVLHTFYRVI